MNENELKEILKAHMEWLAGTGGKCANLRDSDLSYANLRGSDLRGADLSDSDLRGADLSDSDLSDSDLSYANLRGSDLRGADLSCANLCGADLRGAKNIDKILWNINTTFFPLQCPETGAYIAYKKADGLIVELEIPATHFALPPPAANAGQARQRRCAFRTETEIRRVSA